MAHSWEVLKRSSVESGNINIMKNGVGLPLPLPEQEAEVLPELTRSNVVESCVLDHNTGRNENDSRKRPNSFDFDDLDEEECVVPHKLSRFSSGKIDGKGKRGETRTSLWRHKSCSSVTSDKENMDYTISINNLDPLNCNNESDSRTAVEVVADVLTAAEMGHNSKEGSKIKPKNVALADETKSLDECTAMKGDAIDGQKNSKQDTDSVAYVHSQQLMEHCNRLPRIPERAEMIHSLIEALGLPSFLKVVPPRPAEDEEVKQFHSSDYIQFLQQISNQDDEEKIDAMEAVHYGITYDCPVQEGVYDCAALVAGATITAAEALRDGQCRVAINWYGGWHHAQRGEASGFCYINDIVLGILTLRQKFSRILYVDIDLHHGDGVENAFSTTPHVMTVSFHKHDHGFFPGSGDESEVGSGKGKYYSVNVPLKDGIDDSLFINLFKSTMSRLREAYEPEAVVFQCGADCLAGDPMSSFNLTLSAYRHCLYLLMQWKLPLLLLGGGGYHHANTARCWASLTALTVGRKLPDDVPDHKYFPEYGPDYELALQAGNRKNHNSLESLAKICATVRENMKRIKGKQP